MKTWKFAGINFDHMHMGDNLRMVLEHPQARIVGLCDERIERTRAAADEFDTTGMILKELLRDEPDSAPLVDGLTLLYRRQGGTALAAMRLAELVGSRGNDWHLLTSGAFVSMILPLIVFFSLQRFFVRGLLAGSVKG